MGKTLNQAKRTTRVHRKTYQVQPTSVAVSKPQARHQISPDFPAVAGCPHCGHWTNALPHGLVPMRFNMPSLVLTCAGRRRGFLDFIIVLDARVLILLRNSIFTKLSPTLHNNSTVAG